MGKIPSWYDNAYKFIELTGWQRVQCFGHRLNLAVRSGLKKVDDKVKPALNSMKRIIKHFSHSHQKKQALRAKQVRHACGAQDQKIKTMLKEPKICRFFYIGFETCYLKTRLLQSNVS